MHDLKGWLINRSELFSSMASLITIIVFPLVLIGGCAAYYQLRSYFDKADLYLTFVDSKYVAFSIVNKSKVVAEMPLYSFGIFDLDQDLSILPIPAKEISYINGNSEIGPNALMSEYGKIGHRYFGIASISCKNCEKRRIYWIHWTHGDANQSWYAETNDNEPIAVDPKQLRENPELYFDKNISQLRRKQIK